MIKKIVPIFLFIVLSLPITLIGATVSGTLYRDDGVTPIIGEDLYVIASSKGKCTTSTPIGYPPGSDPYPGRYKVEVDPLTGKFILEDLPTGAYVFFTSTGSYNFSNTDSDFFNEYWVSPQSVTDCNDAQLINLTPTQSLENVDFQIFKKASLHGTIFMDDSSIPITGTEIDVTLFTNTSSVPGSSRYEAEVNVSDGTFSIINVLPGTYDLYVEAEGSNFVKEWWNTPQSTPFRESSKKLNIGDGVDLTGIDFQLDVGAVISGAVMEKDGITPVLGDNNFVAVFEEGECDKYAYSYYANIDPVDGSYYIDALPLGSYMLQAKISNGNYVDGWWSTTSTNIHCDQATAITLDTGEIVDNQNFQLQTGAIVSGTVFYQDGGSHFDKSSTYVYIFDSDHCTKSTELNPGDYAWSQVDIVDGTYSIDGLPNGTYYIQAVAQQMYNYINEWWAPSGSVISCAEASPIVLDTAESRSDINLQLDTGATITGTMFHSDGITPITDDFIDLQLFSDDACDNRTLQTGVMRDFNSQTGVYTVNRIPAGNYTLRALNNSGPYLDEWWAGAKSNKSCETASVIKVDVAENLVEHNFQLDQGASISGLLFEQDGTTPFQSQYPTFVYAYANDPCTQQDYVQFATIPKQSQTYSVEGLTAGTYYLQFSDHYTYRGLLVDGYGATSTVTETIDDYVDEWLTTGGSTTDCADAKVVSVASQAAVTGKNFHLNPISELPGDMNLDGIVDLSDAIISLQAITHHPQHSVWRYGDVNYNDTIGMEEIIYVLEKQADH